MSKRVRTKWLAALMGMTLVLTACSSSSTTEPQADATKGEIKVWGWNIAAKSLQAIVPEFNKKYPDIKVVVEDIGRTDVYDKVTAGLSANGAGLPDVIQMETERLPIYTHQFPDGFANLSKLGADAYKDKISASKWQQAAVKDKIIAMPWDIGPAGVFYRTDLFQKAGVDPKAIETWDDLIAAGKKIKQETGTALLPIDVANDDALFRMMLNQLQTYYFDESGNIDLTSEKSVKAMSKIKEMQDAGLVVNANGWDGTVTATKNGSVATVPFGVWYSGTIQDQAPELKGKWDVMQLPAFEKGGNRASNLGGSNLVVPAASKNQSLAYKFVEFAMTDVGAQMVMMKQFGLFPSLLETYKDPFFAEPQAFFNNQPIYQMFAEQSNKIAGVNYTNDYSRALKHVADAQASILLKGTSVKDGLASAAKQIAGESKRKVN